MQLNQNKNKTKASKQTKPNQPTKNLQGTHTSHVSVFPVCCQQNIQAAPGFSAASCGNKKKKSGCVSP